MIVSGENQYQISCSFRLLQSTLHRDKSGTRFHRCSCRRSQRCQRVSRWWLPRLTPHRCIRTLHRQNESHNIVQWVHTHRPISIDVNTGGIGGSRHPNFYGGSWSLHEVLLYPNVQGYELNTLSKVIIF